MICKALRAPPIPPITAFPSSGNNAGASNERNPCFGFKICFSLFDRY